MDDSLSSLIESPFSENRKMTEEIFKDCIVSVGPNKSVGLSCGTDRIYDLMDGADCSVTVRPGTLYRMIGKSVADAMASKCATRPSWLGLL